MNTTNKQKPKSMRIAILKALSDGAITTIDDLQIKVDEPRKKVVDNAAHAITDGLIKRMRDDVTNAPAYQITAKGLAITKGLASMPSIADEEAEVPTVKESLTVAPDDSARQKSEAIALNALEETMPGFTAEVVAQKDAEIGRLTLQTEEYRRLFCAACSDLAKVSQKLGVDPNAGGAAPIIEAIDQLCQTEPPGGFVIARTAKPLVRFTKAISAETRALSFARDGQRAQVYALIPVGVAVPGAEWKPA